MIFIAIYGKFNAYLNSEATNQRETHDETVNRFFRWHDFVIDNNTVKWDGYWDGISLNPEKMLFLYKNNESEFVDFSKIKEVKIPYLGIK